MRNSSFVIKMAPLGAVVSEDAARFARVPSILREFRNARGSPSLVIVLVLVLVLEKIVQCSKQGGEKRCFFEHEHDYERGDPLNSY
jgi:hypothetical protein